MDNNEGFACTLGLWYWHENNVQHGDNIAHNYEGWED
jgi:hypothetical protein